MVDDFWFSKEREREREREREEIFEENKLIFY